MTGSRPYPAQARLWSRMSRPPAAPTPVVRRLPRIRVPARLGRPGHRDRNAQLRGCLLCRPSSEPTAVRRLRCVNSSSTISSDIIIARDFVTDPVANSRTAAGVTQSSPSSRSSDRDLALDRTEGRQHPALPLRSPFSDSEDNMVRARIMAARRGGDSGAALVIAFVFITVVAVAIRPCSRSPIRSRTTIAYRAKPRRRRPPRRRPVRR